MKKEKELTDNQKEILKEFLRTFLPKRGNKRKNPKNEIDYIGTTLNKVFIQNFSFNLSKTDILNAFQELGYDIFTKKGSWDVDHKFLKPSDKGVIFIGNEVYSEYDAAFIYVDVESPMVRQLMLVTFTLPPNTAKEKIEQTETIRMKLNLFKQEVNRKYGI